MKKKNGFTIIETILSMIILSMIIVSISYVSSFTNEKYDDNEMLNYYLFLNNLESDKYQFQIKTIKKNLVGLYSKSKKKSFWLYLRKNNIILTGETTGYVPLVQSVKSFQLETLNNKHCSINIEFLDGQKLNNRIVISNDK